MYRQALSHSLHFYETPGGVRRAADRGRFIPLKGNADFAVGRVNYPYVLPTTHTFITRLAAQYRSACGEKLVITSAVRPKSYRLINSSDRSVHPTGMAVDLRKSRNGTCRSWLQQTLMYLERIGTIEATEEFYPPHFHVAVFPQPYERYVVRRGGEVYQAAGGSYHVRRGDSLWGIARRHGTSVERIKAINDIQGSRIVAGQTLKIPGAR